VLLAGLLALGVGFAGFSALEGDGGPGPQPSTSAGAGTVQDAPAFPGSNQLRDGDWLLSRYSIDQDGGNLVINGTVVNSGPAAASTTLTAYYYIDGKAVAVASGETGEVAPGGSASVTLTSDDAWQPGNPVLVVQAG
jgi:hypothetical protein